MTPRRKKNTALSEFTNTNPNCLPPNVPLQLSSQKVSSPNCLCTTECTTTLVFSTKKKTTSPGTQEVRQNTTAHFLGLAQSPKPELVCLPLSMWPWVKIQIVPVNIPTKIGSKMGGAPAHLPQNGIRGPLVLTHGHMSGCSTLQRPTTRALHERVFCIYLHVHTHKQTKAFSWLTLEGEQKRRSNKLGISR